VTKSKQLDQDQSIQAAKVIVEGEGVDEWGNRYFKFSVKGSKKTIPPFSVSQIVNNQSEFMTALINAGASLFTSNSQRTILKQLEERQPEDPSFKVATRLGWNGSVFVFPDEIVGTPKKPLETSFSDLKPQMLAKYRCKGTLKDWQDKIGSLCIRNSRLIFAASLACTGPVLRFVPGDKSGGFELVGLGETGKTCVAIIAGSFWGCHLVLEFRERGFCETWHTTSGKVEITAFAHNDTILLLDETKLAGDNDKQRGQVVLRVVFSLSEGGERERLTNVGSSRGWRFFFLSTSNLTLAEMAQQAGTTIGEAEFGRLVDIPLPVNRYGIYEDLHGFESGAALTDALKSRCRSYCGTPSREFVRKLVEEMAEDRDGLKKYLRTRRKGYLKRVGKLAEKEGLKLLNRVSGRFATVYAAGCLAIKYGIFPWSRNHLLQAILSCHLDSARLLKDQSQITSSSSSVQTPRQKLVTYLTEQQAEFLDLSAGLPDREEHEFGSVPGYIASHKGEKWYYVAPEQLRELLGGQSNVKELAKTLVADGLMAKLPESRSESRWVVQRPIFSGKGNKGYERVYAFRASILERQAAG